MAAPHVAVADAGYRIGTQLQGGQRREAHARHEIGGRVDLMEESMRVRAAEAAEIDHLGRLWHEVWHGSHAPLAPPDLVRLRTPDSFRERLRAAYPDIHVVGPPGAPVGFCVLRGDELY
jgi:hypothetical protein